MAAGKNTLQRKKAVFAAGKMSAKNAASQREKFKAAEKTPCSSKKAPLQQKKTFWRQRGKTVRGGKKLVRVRGKKKTGWGRKKTCSRESPALQPEKLLQRKKYISATGKSSSPAVLHQRFETKTLPALLHHVQQHPCRLTVGLHSAC